MSRWTYSDPFYLQAQNNRVKRLEKQAERYKEALDLLKKCFDSAQLGIKLRAEVAGYLKKEDHNDNN